MENIKKISQCCEKQAQGSENSELIDVLNDAVDTKDGDNGKQISSIRFINTLFNDDEYNKYEPQLRGWKQNGNIDSYKADINLQLSFIEESEEGTEVTKSQYFNFGDLYITIKPYTYVVKIGLNKNSKYVGDLYKEEYDGVLQNLTSLLNKKYDKQVSVYDEEFDDFEKVLNTKYSQSSFFTLFLFNIHHSRHKYFDSVSLDKPDKTNISNLMLSENLIGLNTFATQRKNNNFISLTCSDDSSENSKVIYYNIFGENGICIIVKVNNVNMFFKSSNYHSVNKYENVKIVKNQRYLLDK